MKDELDALAVEKLIKNTDIIAMTTTGRSKYNNLLKNIQFPIIVVEEAAEVLEAHIVASLS